MSLLPLFRWMDSIQFFKGSWSDYLGPGLNTIHLLSMVVFTGALLIVDLRLLGGVLKRHPVAPIARDAQPWLVGGLLMLVATGIPAVFASAMAEYRNPMFWYKMYFLLAGLIFTFTVRYRVARADEARIGRILPKVVGLVSIALWGTVAASARLIMLLA